MEHSSPNPYPQQVPDGNGHLIIVVLDPYLVALTPHDGVELWRHRLGRNSAGTSNAIVLDRTVVTASGDRVVGLSMEGQELWSFTPESQAALGITTATTDVVLFGTRNHHVYAVDAITGIPVWSTDIGPDWPWLGLVRGVGHSGDTAYAAATQYLNEHGGLRRGVVVALDLTSGQEIWRWEDDDDESDVIAPPLVTDSLLVLSGFYDGSVKALNRFTGDLVWRFTNADHAFGPSQTVEIVGDIIYAASQDGLHAIDRNTGGLVWERTGGEFVGGTDVRACGDVLVYANQFINVVDRSDGGLLDRFLDGTDEFALSAIGVVGDVAVVVGNRKVYGITCGE